MIRARRAAGATSALAVVVVLVAGLASATRLPSPGTPGEVATLVAGSHRIETLPSDLVPTLQRVGDDNAATWGYWKAKDGCTGATQCVYGDTAAIRTVALLGDSHAAMWLPALDWVGLKLGFRWWCSGGPGARRPTSPSATRLHALGRHGVQRLPVGVAADIEALAPALVLTADRTTDVARRERRGHPDRDLAAGPRVDPRQPSCTARHVAVIGDVTPLSTEIPECLAAYPRAVQQRCSSPNPNPAMRTELGRGGGGREGRVGALPQPRAVALHEGLLPRRREDTRCTTTGSTCQRRTPPTLASSGRTRSSRCWPPEARGSAHRRLEGEPEHVGEVGRVRRGEVPGAVVDDHVADHDRAGRRARPRAPR